MHLYSKSFNIIKSFVLAGSSALITVTSLTACLWRRLWSGWSSMWTTPQSTRPCQARKLKEQRDLQRLCLRLHLQLRLPRLQQLPPHNPAQRKPSRTSWQRSSRGSGGNESSGRTHGLVPCFKRGWFLTWVKVCLLPLSTYFFCVDCKQNCMLYIVFFLCCCCL